MIAPTGRPCELRKEDTANGPVLSAPDSSAPSPPESLGSGQFAGSLSPYFGPTKVGPFLFLGPLIVIAEMSDAPFNNEGRLSGHAAVTCESGRDLAQSRKFNEAM